MTEETFLFDRTNSKATMWNGYRSNRCFPLLLIVYVIIFSGIMFYLEKSRWQEAMKSLNDIKSVVSDQVEIIAQMEMRIHTRNEINKDRNKPIIYAITPTFARPVQKAELTRLAQTFLHVPNFYWIIIEDADRKTELVTNFLKESGLVYTHLNAITPANHKLGRNDPNWKKARGVAQRNAALKWLRENRNDSFKGVVYFADDDNTYAVKLFTEIEKIKKVGVWPVGLVGGLMVEKPICDNTTNRVTGFNAVWKPERTFPLDMAGFAINLRIILEKKNVWFSYETRGGYQETDILEQLVTRNDLEPLADFCTKVYVWHTRTEPPILNAEHRLIVKGKKSNSYIEV